MTLVQVSTKAIKNYRSTINREVYVVFIWKDLNLRLLSIYYLVQKLNKSWNMPWDFSFSWIFGEYTFLLFMWNSDA